MAPGERIVQQGEGISSIAFETGFFWPTILNDPANAALKELRPNPEVLMPGDRVTIPAVRQKSIDCVTGKRHVFKRRGVPSKIEFQVKTTDVVFAGCKYVLTTDAVVLEGTTGDDGRLCHWVPPTVRRATLEVWLATDGYPESVQWILNVGNLDPAGTMTGIQARLINLGYRLDGEHGTPGPLTADAIADIQQKAGLTVTGTIDAATTDAIAKMHGS